MSEHAEKDRLAELAKRAHFENLYFKWLEARTAWADPCGDESDDAMAEKTEASEEAGAKHSLFQPSMIG